MDIPLLIHTHSEFSFLWKAAIPLLQRYAAGFKIYWITESLGGYQMPADWEVRFYDPALPWSARMAPVLKEIPNEYVIYLQEDWLLIDTLSADRLAGFVKFMKERSCEFLMSFPCPTCDFFYSEKVPSYVTTVGKAVFHRRPHHYMQPAIWKKSLLEEVCAVPLKLSEYENRWSIDLTGARNCMGVSNSDYKNCHSTTSLMFPHMHAIHNGQWTFKRYPTLRALIEAYGIDTSDRTVNDYWLMGFQ